MEPNHFCVDSCFLRVISWIVHLLLETYICSQLFRNTTLAHGGVCRKKQFLCAITEFPFPTDSSVGLRLLCANRKRFSTSKVTSSYSASLLLSVLASLLVCPHAGGRPTCHCDSPRQCYDAQAPYLERPVASPDKSQRPRQHQSSHSSIRTIQIWKNQSC